MPGYDCTNKNRSISRRKVDSELAATTSVGSVFPMCGAATAKARLPTVDSLTGGTTTSRLALAERIADCSLRKIILCHSGPIIIFGTLSFPVGVYCTVMRVTADRKQQAAAKPAVR